MCVALFLMLGRTDCIRCLFAARNLRGLWRSRDVLNAMNLNSVLIIFFIFRGSPKKNSSLYWKSIKLMRVISWRITCENPAPPRHIWDTSLARWAHFMCESFACPWQPVLSCRFSACSSYSGSSAYSSLLCEQNAQAVRWISNPIRNFLTTNLSFN